MSRERVKKAMDAQGLSMTELAIRAMRSRTRLSTVINREIPTRKETVVGVAAALKVSAEDLLTDDCLSPAQRLKRIQREKRDLERRERRVLKTIERG